MFDLDTVTIIKKNHLKLFDAAVTLKYGKGH